MTVPLTEAFIAKRLHLAYQPNKRAATDGYAEWKSEKRLKNAAVLVPFVWFADEWHLVLTRRTEIVEHHKGQVSFPGGAGNSDETTPEETALREAEEEIGLKPEDVRLLGRLNDIITVTHYRVTSVAGVMPWPYPLRPEPAEVDRIFTIPLLWLSDRNNWSEQPFTPEGAPRSFPVVIYHSYDGEVLWGASARIVQIFLKVLKG